VRKRNRRRCHRAYQHWKIVPQAAFPIFVNKGPECVALDVRKRWGAAQRAPLQRLSFPLQSAPTRRSRSRQYCTTERRYKFLHYPMALTDTAHKRLKARFMQVFERPPSLEPRCCRTLPPWSLIPQERSCAEMKRCLVKYW